MVTVLFHGTKREQSALLAALAHNCTCEQDPESGISKSCPGHTALVTDQRWLDHMEFARWMRVRLRAQEFMEDQNAD